MVHYIAIALALVIGSVSAAQAINECSGGNRKARKVTCIVDGDTGWEKGVKWRLKNVDTPERGSRAECSKERILHKKATARLISLMKNGYTLSGNGKGGYGRRLVNITLADGRDAGRILLQESLAQPWPNNSNPWCR